MQADVGVRPARMSDAGEIGRIQVATWRTAYADVLPPAVLEALGEPQAVEIWQAAVIAPPSPYHHVLVAHEHDTTVGFTALGPAAGLGPDEPDAQTTVEINPLLVEPRWGRRGHGSRLLAAAVDHARADGLTRAITWIPETDAVSREFYLSAGWAPDGLARALDTGAGEFREIRLHAVLD